MREDEPESPPPSLSLSSEILREQKSPKSEERKEGGRGRKERAIDCAGGMGTAGEKANGERTGVREEKKTKKKQEHEINKKKEKKEARQKNSKNGETKKDKKRQQEEKKSAEPNKASSELEQRRRSARAELN